MTVYVDDAFIAARVGRITSHWCHMSADTRAELDEMADRLGLRRSWIQHPGEWSEHYDVTEGKRRQAVALGAVEIAWRDAVELHAARRAYLRAHTTPVYTLGGIRLGVL